MKTSPATSTLKFGGVILCGGKSKRMGQPKLSLPFGDELMLQRVVRILSTVVYPIVVVAAEDQKLPRLPSDIIIARDEQENLGPLGGISVGLKALTNLVDAAYVSGCDTPLLQPAFVQKMLDSLSSYDIAIPQDGKYHHPLAAVYRLKVLGKVQQLITTNRMRPLFLIEECHSLQIEVNDLRDVDATLESLRNINSPEDYLWALRKLEEK